MYLDECQIHTHPQLDRCWQRRGCPTRIPAAGTDQRLSVFGALDYASGILTTQQGATVNAAAFEAFLDQVVARWPTGGLVLVLDNASYHKTASLRAWFAANQARITVLWLPTYSPQLNLIERVWRFLKTKLACHRFWNDRDGLATRTQTLCDAILATFHAATSPRIRFTQDFCLST